jgi:hypothetical protein
MAQLQPTHLPRLILNYWILHSAQDLEISHGSEAQAKIEEAKQDVKMG